MTNGTVNEPSQIVCQHDCVAQRALENHSKII